MPDKFYSAAEAFLFVLMLASGAIGGCTAASHKAIGGKSFTAWLFLAYGVLGAFFGGVVLVLNGVFFEPVPSMTQLLVYSMVSGFCGAATLSATNVSARFILKKLGIEIRVEVDRLKK